MKKIRLIQTMIVGISLCLSTAFAATSFNGGEITDSGAWSGGLPTSANPGTIGAGADGTFADGTHNGYVITQSGSTITAGAPGTNLLFEYDAGTYTMDGGTLDLQSNFRLIEDSTFTLNSGSITGTTRWIAPFSSSAALVINGGTISTNAVFTRHGGSITINGGTITGGDLGHRWYSAGEAGGDININGGTISVNQYWWHPDSVTTIGGTSGSITINSFRTQGPGDLFDNVNLNWINLTDDSEMSMRLPGDNGWYETLWNAGRMTYAGKGYMDLGTWDIASPGRFIVNGDTITAIPEPSTYAVLAGLLALGLVIARRRAALGSK